MTAALGKPYPVLSLFRCGQVSRAGRVLESKIYFGKAKTNTHKTTDRNMMPCSQ